MFGGHQEIGSRAGENPEKQCRLCLRSSREYYSLKKRFEDTPPVHAVIRALLSFIEDSHDLPQQVCTGCTKELLHFTRLKEHWVANQFALARQQYAPVAKSTISSDSQADNFAPQSPPQEMPEVCVEIKEDVDDFSNLSDYGVDYSKQRTDTVAPPPEEVVPQESCSSKQDQHSDQVTGAMRRFSKTRLEYRCFVCTTGYNSMKMLLLHLNDHSQLIPHRCKQCVGKVQIFHSVFALNRHLRSHYSNDSRRKEVKPSKPKPTGCNDCGLMFESVEEKRAHDKRQHFRCETCDAGFTTQSSLNAHMKIHTGERPHQCVYCGKKFSRLFNMKDHMRRHLDDFSHSCPICPKKFFNSRQVNNHIESVHGGANRAAIRKKKRPLLGGVLAVAPRAESTVVRPRVVVNENGLVDFAPDGRRDDDDDDDGELLAVEGDDLVPDGNVSNM